MGFFLLLFFFPFTLSLLVARGYLEHNGAAASSVVLKLPNLSHTSKPFSHFQTFQAPPETGKARLPDARAACKPRALGAGPVLPAAPRAPV